MRQTGHLQEWNDARGFGFVVPEGNGERAFVHIRAFENRGSRRPIEGERLSYVPGIGPDGRPRAQQVRWTDGVPPPGRHREKRQQRRPDDPRRWRLFVAAAFLVLVCAFALPGTVPTLLAALYLGMSLLTFIAYALDKHAAKTGRWRTPEATLHLMELAGGWPGALLAQQLLRHKNRKLSYQLAFWIIVGLNLLALTLLLGQDDPARAIAELLRRAGR